MSTIRRQSIISSGIIYLGFALGFLNTYLFTRQGGFTQTQYGLTGIFMSIGSIMYSFANLGMQAYIYKFYPYYQDNLSRKNNDLITWALLAGIAGFSLVLMGGFIFKHLVIRKFGAHSSELLNYYYWIFPFGFGLTMYSLLEAYAWQVKKSVLTSYLREVQFRVFTTILIVFFVSRIFSSFDIFIKFYTFGYIIITITLLVILLSKKEINFTIAASRVSKKFWRKIMVLAGFVWSGGLLHNIAAVFAPIVIAAVMPRGLANAGIFIIAQYMTSIMQAPQRGIIAASLAPLSKAWKDKDLEKIKKIYHASSINQLLFSTGIFVLIWLNFKDGITSFHLQQNYLESQYVFFFLGLACIIDMGTGVNSQIIGTSTFWRFDFITGIVLLALSLPLTYILTKNTGVVGPAIANLISFTIYNLLRYLYLLKKFNMQPFSLKTLYTILSGLGGYLICWFLFDSHNGFIWIILRSFLFILLYIFATIRFNLSPDVLPVWKTIKKRIGIKASNV
jgi:O-antigen/teichoic acid export membrane protein